MNIFDDILKELRRIGDELGAPPVEAAEQARVIPKHQHFGVTEKDCPVCIGAEIRCYKCLKVLPDPSGPCPNCERPAPVVERFVMWEYPERHCMDGTAVTQIFTRRKRGDVVANICGKSGMSGQVWRVEFPDGSVKTIYDSVYQTLKANGCFGEQQS